MTLRPVGEPVIWLPSIRISVCGRRYPAKLGRRRPGPGDLEIIQELAGYPGVRAIGETGLDCYWDDTPMPLQQEYFDWHMELCRATSLPMVIHMRDSGDLIVEQLGRQQTVPPGVMHSFTGDVDTARRVP